jgi:hypothetical protein
MKVRQLRALRQKAKDLGMELVTVNGVTDDFTYNLAERCIDELYDRLKGTEDDQGVTGVPLAGVMISAKILPSGLKDRPQA